MNRFLAFVLALSTLLGCHKTVPSAPEPPKMGMGQPAMLACQSTGNYTTDCTQATDSVAMTPDASVALWSLKPSLIPNERIKVFSRVDLEYTGDAGGGVCDAGGCTGTIFNYTSGQFANGVFIRPDGGTQSDVLRSYLYPPLNNCSSWIQGNGTGGLTTYATCPVSAAAGTGDDYQRRVAFGSIAAVTSVSPSVAATTLGTNTTITFRCAFGCTGAYAATVDGVSLTGVSASNDTTVTGTLPIGTYSAGTGAVVVAAPGAPLALAGGFSFVAPAVTSISPTQGDIGGGASFTATLSAGATGVSGLTLKGVAATSVVATDDQHITGVSGAGTVGTGNVVATTPSSPAALVNGWTYTNQGTPGAISATYPNRGVSGTVLHGTISTCVGCTTSNTTAAFVCSGTAVAATLTSIPNSASPGSFTVTVGSNAESATANNCNLAINSGGTLGGGGYTGGNSSTGGTGVWFQNPAGQIANFDAKYGNGISYTTATGVNLWTEFQNGYNATQATGTSQPAGVTANYNTSGFPAIAPTGTTGGTTQYLLASTFPTTSAPMTTCWVGDSIAGASLFAYDGNVNGGTRCFVGGVSSNQWSCNDGIGTALLSPSTFTNFTPVELCFVDNGASSALYVNGTSVATGTVSTSLAGIQNGLSVGAIGPFVGGGGYLNGHEAQLQIWNVALNATQIGHIHLEDVADWKTP